MMATAAENLALGGIAAGSVIAIGLLAGRQNRLITARPVGPVAVVRNRLFVPTTGKNASSYYTQLIINSGQGVRVTFNILNNGDEDGEFCAEGFVYHSNAGITGEGKYNTITSYLASHPTMGARLRDPVALSTGQPTWQKVTKGGSYPWELRSTRSLTVSGRYHATIYVQARKLDGTKTSEARWAECYDQNAVTVQVVTAGPLAYLSNRNYVRM